MFEFDTFTSETVLPRIEKYYNKCASGEPYHFKSVVICPDYFLIFTVLVKIPNLQVKILPIKILKGQLFCCKVYRFISDSVKTHNVRI